MTNDENLRNLLKTLAASQKLKKLSYKKYDPIVV